jgi:hypothetical protein
VAAVLVGRTGELALVSAFAQRARIDGEALLVFGEPGVGKTALLDAAAEEASGSGTRVLRAAGVEFEAELAYSGLHQVLLPVFGEFGQLSAVHRDALNAALGFSETPPPGRLVVSAATLTVLRQAAAANPVLVIVDDLPWLDRASADVLGFAARRLAGSRAGFLGASRPGHESFFERASLPRCELGPLDERAADDLVRARFPDLAPLVHQRVVAEAQGNPLALLELPAALSGAQHAAAEALPAVLPLSRRLHAVFASRVSDLPERSRWLLLLAALDGTGDLHVLQAAGGGRGAVDSLAPAEQVRLVHVDDHTGKLTFRHPLTRSAVIELSTSRDRRRAHQALAAQLADQPERQAWHLAAAATGPDEHAADLLEQVASRLMRRGDATGAVTALLRAADLSPDDPSRNRRLAAAAYAGATMTREFSSVSRSLAAARGPDPQPGESLRAAVTTAYMLLNTDGDIKTAYQLLISAIGTEAGADDASEDIVIPALQALMDVCYNGGRAELWPAFDAAISRLSPCVPADLLLLGQAIADPARTPVPVLGELDTAVRSLVDETDHWRILTISAAAIFHDRLAGCRDALLRVVRDSQAGGAVAPAVGALTSLSLNAFSAGRWDEARRLSDGGLDLALATGGEWMLAWLFRYHKAMLAAARGDPETARALADEIAQWAAPRGAGLAQTHAHHVRVLAAMGQGDFEDAYQHAAAISPPGTLASHVPLALWVAMDLVEAAGRTGRHAEATVHATAIRDAGIAALSPRLALLATAAEAIAAPDDIASELFELSNKQIGQRLFLSHRTVGAHLYQIFPKLGVTSRAALRDALASAERGHDLGGEELG